MAGNVETNQWLKQRALSKEPWIKPNEAPLMERPLLGPPVAGCNDIRSVPLVPSTTDAPLDPIPFCWVSGNRNISLEDSKKQTTPLCYFRLSRGSVSLETNYRRVGDVITGLEVRIYEKAGRSGSVI